MKGIGGLVVILALFTFHTGIVVGIDKFRIDEDINENKNQHLRRMINEFFVVRIVKNDIPTQK